MPSFSRVAVAFTALYAGFLLPSCSQSGGVEQISETRTLTAPKEAPKEDVSSAQRFGMTAQPARQAMASAPAFSFKTPEGWEELPTKEFRPINLRPAGDPKAECYVSSFGGSGGGLTENVNRWRKQMKLDPVDEAAVAALPKKPLLGGEATYVELDGNYGGMSGDQDNPDFKMVGLILSQGGSAVFIKFTGPKALVEQEKAKFEEFCASIAPAEDPHAGMAAAGAASGPDTSNLPEGHPPVGTAMPGADMPPEEATKLSWTAPEGWVQSESRAMREVTFTLGPDSKTECYVSRLLNRGGGLENNINRWAGQMGLGPLSADAIAALPKIKVLGNDCPVVELKGAYTDMSGAEHADSLLLGAISEVGTDAYFIKMVGPAAEVEAQKANFSAFCESLKL